MTTTLLRTDTKQHRLDTAEFSTRTWRWLSDLEGSARCVLCGSWISTTRIFVGGRSESWFDALVGAMLTHFELDHRAVAA
jgi:hypothetical protein